MGTTLGEVIIEAAMQTMYLYYDTKEFNINKVDEGDKNDVKEFKRRDHSELKNLLKALKDPIKYPADKLAFTYRFTLPNDYLSGILKDHLELHCIQESIIAIDLNRRNELQILFNKIELDLGIEVLYFLKEIDIIDFHRDNKNVPFIKMLHNYK